MRGGGRGGVLVKDKGGQIYGDREDWTLSGEHRMKYTDDVP